MHLAQKQRRSEDARLCFLSHIAGETIGFTEKRIDHQSMEWKVNSPDGTEQFRCQRIPSTMPTTSCTESYVHCSVGLIPIFKRTGGYMGRPHNAHTSERPGSGLDCRPLGTYSLWGLLDFENNVGDLIKKTWAYNPKIAGFIGALIKAQGFLIRFPKREDHTKP